MNIKHDCFMASAYFPDCSGRRLYRKFVHGKEWVCKACWTWIKAEPYCMGGMTLCESGCGEHCRKNLELK